MGLILHRLLQSRVPMENSWGESCTHPPSPVGSKTHGFQVQTRLVAILSTYCSIPSMETQKIDKKGIISFFRLRTRDVNNVPILKPARNF